MTPQLSLDLVRARLQFGIRALRNGICVLLLLIANVSPTQAQTGEARESAGAAGAASEPACHYGERNGLTVPDRSCTPGTAATTDISIIRKTNWGDDERHVTPKMKEDVCHAYGIMSGCPGKKWELDHLKPRCAGGADDDMNLWPEPILEARMKDTLERKTCKDLKDRKGPRITVEAAQNRFAYDQWTDLIPKKKR